MRKLLLVCVGKLKERYWREAVAEYEKRLSRFCKLEIRELPERPTLKAEGEDILRACRGQVLSLAVEGKQYDSEGFSRRLCALADAGEVTLVIGSSCGLDGAVKAASGELISFSRLTFPHQMMRVVLLEQVYRAFMIESGSEYHK